MINWHIRRCVAKGLIKLQQAPLRRYLYYLTPAGFVEKADLTARFLQSSFSIFRMGKEQYEALFARCADNLWNSVALIGQTELTELALMVAPGISSVRVLGVIDHTHSSDGHEQPGSTPRAASGMELLKQTGVNQVGAVIVCHYLTDHRATATHHEVIRELNLDTSRLLVPEFLV